MTHRTGFHDGRLGIGLEINGGGDGSGKPRYPLDINGDIRLSGAIVDSSGNPIQMMAQQRTFPNAITTVEKEDIGDGTVFGAGTFKLNGLDTYYTDGNVGIGTADPGTYKLKVAGSVMIDDYIYHNEGNENTYFGFPSDDSFRIVTGGTNKLTIDQSRAYFNLDIELPSWIYHKDDTTTKIGFQSNGNIYLNCSDTTVMRVNNNGVGIHTSAPSNSSTRFQVGGNAYISGNVGIGTTDPPGEKLEVNGNIKLGNSNGTHITDNQIYRPGNNDFHIQYGGSGDLTMCYGGGNVGIGTTSPDSKLHVNGNITIDACRTGSGYPTGSVGGGISFRAGAAYTPDSATGAYNCSILTYAHDQSTDGLSINGYDGVSFCTGSSTRNEQMRINSSGDVGIGTPSPGAKLEVSGTVKSSGVSIDNTGGIYRSKLQIGTLDTSYASWEPIYKNPDSKIIIFETQDVDWNYSTDTYTADASILLVRQLTSPNGNSSACDTGAIGFVATTKDYGSDQMQLASRIRGQTVGSSYGGRLFFETNSGGKIQLRMTINDSGNVGIGVDNASYKLDVAGSINVAGRGYFSSGWTGGASRPYTFSGYGSVNIHTGAYSSNDFLYDGGSTASVWASGDQAPGSASDSTSYFTMDVAYGICIHWGGVWTDSDRRIKRDIEDAPDNLSLEYLRNIPIRYYNYRDPDLQSKNKVIGFIAQEVEEIYPDAVWERAEIIPDELRNIEIGNNAFWETDSSDNLILYVSDLSGAIPGKKVRFWVKDSRNEYKTELNIEAMEDGKRFKFEKKWEKLFIYGKTCLDRKGICKEKLFAISFSACQELDKQQQADKAEIAELKTKVTTLESTLETVLARLTELENK